MNKLLVLALFMGSVVCGATNFPSHIGMGSKASTVGKISSYSSVRGGLWTGYWKPNGLTVNVKEEVTVQPSVSVWPNPTNGQFNIDYNGNVKILSSIGSLVFQGEINGHLDISSFPAGMYFIRTEDGKTIKIIKQ